MSHEETYKKLDWPVFFVRHDYLSLIKCYKIVFRISDHLNFSDSLQMHISTTFS